MNFVIHRLVCHIQEKRYAFLGTWSNLRKHSGFQVKNKKTSEKSKDNPHEIKFQSFPNWPS